MEMQQLRYFVAIAEQGSFSKAAQSCFVAQPSLSQQISKLEQELGVPLFDRTGKRVLLTAAGHMLLEHARSILSTVEYAGRELRDAVSRGSGRLSVGFIPTIAPYLLPGVLQTFLSKNPDVDLTIHEDYTDRLVAALCEGTIDVAIAALPLEHPLLEFEELGRDPLLLSLPANHPLATKPEVLVSDVAAEPFLLLQEMHCLTDQIMSFCRSRDFLPRVVCRNTQVSTVQALLATGHGISLLPALVRDSDDNPARVYRAFSDADPSRTLVALRHKQRFQMPQAGKFVASVRKILEKQPS